MKPSTLENDTFNKWRIDTNKVSTNVGDPESIYNLDGKGFTDSNKVAVADVNITTDVISCAGHTIVANNALEYIQGATPIGGLVNGTIYYARDIIAGTSFKVAATVGGTAINLTSTGSGTHFFVNLGAETTDANYGKYTSGGVFAGEIVRDPVLTQDDAWDVIATLNDINERKVKRSGDWIRDLHVVDDLYVSGTVYLGAVNSDDDVWFRSPNLKTTKSTVSIFDATATTATVLNAGTSITIGANASGTTTIRNATTAISNALTVGTTATISGNFTANGSINTIGDSSADTLVLTAVLNSNQTFKQGANRTISIETHATTVGNSLSILAGSAGGAGDATGGALILKSGDKAGTNGNAGTLTVDTGIKGGTGTATIDVGGTNATAINIGRSSGVVSKVNNVTITPSASGSTLTIASGKTLTVNNTLTFAGFGDGFTHTFPASNTSVARIDAAQTFVGLQTFSNDIDPMQSRIGTFDSSTTTETSKTVFTALAATFGSGELIIQAKQGTNIKMTKLIFVCNQTNGGIDSTEYATTIVGSMGTSEPFYTISNDGTNVTVLANMSVASNPTSFRVFYSLIKR